MARTHRTIVALLFSLVMVLSTRASRAAQARVDEFQSNVLGQSVTTPNNWLAYNNVAFPIVVDPADSAGAVYATVAANGNGIPDLWETTYSQSDVAADGDFDGVKDFFEFLGGGNPGFADSEGSIAVKLLDYSNAAAQFSWRVRNGVVIGTNYVAETSSDCATKNRLTAADYTVVSTVPTDTGYFRITVVILSPIASTPLFFRLATP